VNSCIRRGLSYRWIALQWLIIPIAALGHVTGVGFCALQVPDPVNGGNMSGYVF
jgi:hypothetical protein